MSKVTLSVPKGTEEFTLSYGGRIDQPQTYKPSDSGTVQVEQEHLHEFLRFLPSAKPASASAETAVENATEAATSVPDAAGAVAGRRATPAR